MEDIRFDSYCWDITTFNQLIQPIDASRKASIKRIIKDTSRPGDGMDHTFVNLEGIEEFTNLEVLKLDFECTVQDISALSSLKTLKEVSLYGIETGLDALNNSIHLEILRLKTQFPNLQSLPVFPNLKQLDLSNSNIQDLSGIERFTSITTLSLCTISPVSFEPIKYLTQLTTLKLTHNSHIVHLSFLSPLVNLTSLDLSVNYNIEDISPVKNLVKLEELSLYSSKKVGQESLGDLFQSLKQLKKLSLHEMDINSLECLAALHSSVEYVLLYGNPVRDFSLLKSFTKLKSLVVDYALVDELRPFLPDVSITYNPPLNKQE